MTKYLFLALSFLVSCSTQDKKIYVKSIVNSKNEQYNWYIYSLITSYSHGFIEKEGSDEIIFRSGAISNIKFKNDTLIIEFFDKTESESLEIINNVKTEFNGARCNSSSRRLDKLLLKKVNVYKPHFEKSDAEIYECQ